MVTHLEESFTKRFGGQGQRRTFFAPGRVNLIGEHIDYNGGHVFPCALNIGTYAVVRERADRMVRCYSENFPELGVVEFSLDQIRYEEKHQWANYPKGVLKVLDERGYPLSKGLDLFFSGNIPCAAGLSSSASIEVLMATIAIGLGNLSHLTGQQTALICQQAENEFIGVQCGIMDQFAIALGKPDQAILLNCHTLAHQYAPLELGEHILVIANTNKQRGLADSKYNERRAECDRALSQLQSQASLSSLCQLDVAQLEERKGAITSPIDYRRARHAVSENQRTLQAFRALQNGDLSTLGRLMTESHLSLRQDYQVTGPELDALAAAAWSHSGCLGSRMTGAGFGGCSVSLVHKDQLDDFIQSVAAEYRRETGLQADFYPVRVGNGAAEILA